jgi:hypothetical protein
VLIGVLIVVVLGLGGLYLWRRRAKSCGRAIDALEGEYERVFWGGVMCRHLITSGTLARLEFFDWGVRVRGTMVSRWVVPTWEARYEELAVAELVALRWSRIAVWLKPRGESGGMAFLSDRSTEILPLLEARGVPVNRALAQIGRVQELYQD